MVVLDDADPATVAEAIKIGGYFNSGQDCTASSRILVSEQDLRRRPRQAVEAVESLTVGDPGRTTRSAWARSSRPSSRSASSASSSARPTRRRRSSRAAGRVGDRGFFVKPTIVTDVAQQAEIVQNEVFGPVVTMQAAASDDAAIEMANDIRYGLAASVFSENVGRAMKVAAKLDFGAVWVNEHLFPLTPEMPHGGFKESGYGKDMSHLLDGGVHADQARLREARLRMTSGVPDTSVRSTGSPHANGARRSASRTSSSASTTRSPSTGSRSRSRAARSSRCSARRAAGRRRRCG